MNVQELTPEAVPALGQFLTDGFGFPSRPPAFSDAVLSWKYLSPIADEPVLTRSLVQWKEGRVVGHIGLNHRRFHLPDGTRVTTTHPMDWLAAAKPPGVGINLMVNCFGLTQTQYAVGGTDVAQRIQAALGFKIVTQGRIMRKFVRPWSRLRMATGRSRLRQLVGVAADYARPDAGRWGRGRAGLTLERVDEFGPEVDQLVAASECRVCHSSRSAGLFNHLLAYPGGGLSGWLVRERDENIGLAILNVARGQPICEGRIVECLIGLPDRRRWRGAVAAVAREAASQGAEIITALASSPHFVDALVANGFAGRNTVPVRIRDPGKLLSAEMDYHVTYLEADLGYLEG